MNDQDVLAAGTPIKILIVDDHPIVREGLAARIARQPDLTVCGEAEDVAAALELVKTTQPDLVIVDLSLKTGRGLDLIRRILAYSATTKTLVSSMFDEALYAERALRAGALGYVNKQEMSEKIIEAIRHVLGGKIYLSPAMTERLLHRAVGSAPAELAPSPLETLSDRELEVFKLIGHGKSTRQIAADLHLSMKTIETHRENIKNKLNIMNAAELSREAVQWVMESGT